MGSAAEPRIGIGIDVGGTKILAVAVAESSEVLERARVASPASTDGLADALCASIEALGGVVGARIAGVAAVGLALPGLVTPRGALHAAPNLGAAEVEVDIGADLGEPLVARLRAVGAVLGPDAIVYDNDATSAAFGETNSGAAAGEGDTLVISFGTGIGAGIVSGGRVLRGGHGFAGEIGHMVIDPDGPTCPCGRRGCWERYASGSGLALLGRAALERTGREPGDLRGEDVVGAARRGEGWAKEAIGRFAQFVALGLANAVEILDPTTIVLGGGLMAASDVLYEPIVAAYLAENRPAQGRRASDLVLASLGDEAAAIGAGLLGLAHLDDRAAARK